MSGPFSRLIVEAILRGPFVAFPFVIAIQPQGLGLPKKLRVCRNLSKASKSFPSTNSFISKEDFPTDVDTALYIAQIVSPPFLLPFSHFPPPKHISIYGVHFVFGLIPIHGIHPRVRPIYISGIYLRVRPYLYLYPWCSPSCSTSYPISNHDVHLRVRPYPYICHSPLCLSSSLSMAFSIYLFLSCCSFPMFRCNYTTFTCRQGCFCPSRYPVLCSRHTCIP